MKIHKAVVKSQLTYAAEIWAVTAQTKQVLQTTKINTWRFMVGEPRLDRVENEDMRAECGIEVQSRLLKEDARMELIVHIAND